jgi:hypothetical protein
VVSIVTRALAKRLEDRYETAGELAGDLRAAMGEPLRVSGQAVTPTPAWGGPVEEGASVHPVWGRLLLVAAVAVLLALVVTRLWP